MSLARFLVEPGALAGLGPRSPFVLDGDEGRHAAAVRRVRAGETVDLADGAGTVARCTVVAAARASLDLLVDDVSSVPRAAVRFGLVQALAKGGRDEQAVETATEVGVDAVVPWQAGRSVSRWEGEKLAKGRARWQATAREAAKQSRRAWVPLVEEPLTTSGLCARLAVADVALVLHEEATESLVSVDLPVSGEVLVLVGPEGGIGADELDQLRAAGARPVRLGAEVLRTSSAGPVALAWLSAATGRWA
ncbi:16S rRNA (uracil(1498)-N(3))-methyltransferase [Spongisporangium articulatum]|uniref:Ribosomal RNA small subunit methyltransferase E n=1 Tax=Spongisporangium articulatum TaxID=3362603 RepID=A0ABW8AL81_9ACTN